MKPIPKPFVYRTAEETRAPGYLARRFARIRAEQSRTAAEAQDKVRVLPKKAAK